MTVTHINQSAQRVTRERESAPHSVSCPLEGPQAIAITRSPSFPISAAYRRRAVRGKENINERGEESRRRIMDKEERRDGMKGEW